MKAKHIFLLFSLFTLSVFAQDSDSVPAPVPQPSPTVKLLSKGDSLMVILAAKQHIDTNASAGDIGTLFDQDEKLIPKGSPAKYPLAWLKFLAALVFLGGTIYFYLKHQGLKAKALAQGLKFALLGFVFMSMAGCKTSAVTLVNDMEKYVEAHCPKTTVTGPTGAPIVKYDCEGLWKLSNPYCSQATMCVDFINGSITGTLACQDTSLVKAIGTVSPLKK